MRSADIISHKNCCGIRVRNRRSFMSKNRDKKKREQKKYLERVRRQKGKKSATPHRAELIASLPPNTRIVDAIPGLPKMSEQMMAFIDPYASEADSFESRRWLLMVGQAAWNIALRPPEERATMVADLVKTFQANGSEHAPTDRKSTRLNSSHVAS